MASIPHTATMVTLIVVFGVLVVVAGLVWAAGRHKGTYPSRGHGHVHGSSTDSYGDSGGWSDGGWSGGGDGGGGGGN